MTQPTAAHHSYLYRHVTQLFAGAFNQKHNYKPIKPVIPMPTSDQVQHQRVCGFSTVISSRRAQVSKAVSLIKNASNPVVVLGSQATLPPVKPEELRAALEGMGKLSRCAALAAVHRSRVVQVSRASWGACPGACWAAT